MFKFLHIADIHFDAPLLSKDNHVRSDLKLSQKNAFRDAIDLCIKEHVDGLIIAGDLFDNERVSLETEKFLWEKFELLNEHKIQVFYAPGNHDPVIETHIKFGDNVHVFNRDTPFEYILKDNNNNKKECHLIGVGHLNNNEKRNLIKKFPRKNTSNIFVGIVHTMVEGVEARETKGKYLPTTLEDLLEKKYDYWALGHIHQLTKFKEFPIYYSGTIQGLDINETGIKGGNLITFKNGTTDVKFIPLNGILYHQCKIDISGEYDTELDIYRKVKFLLESEIETIDFSVNNIVLRVYISGKTNLSKYLYMDESIKYFEEELTQDLGLKSLEIKVKNILGMKSINEIVLDNQVLEEVLELINNPQSDEKFYKNIGEIKFQLLDREKDPPQLLVENKTEIIEYLMSYFAGDES